MMKRMQRIVQVVCSFALLASINNCDIDVGNPHGVTSDQGQLSLAIADAPTDNAHHVYLYIASLSVIPLLSDGSDGDPIAVTLSASGKTDILALRDGKSLDLSLAQTLPIGNYSGVILGLEEDKPSVLVDADGKDNPLPIADDGHAIRIFQTFQVAVDQHLSLTLHLDLRRSISERGGDQRYAFDPYASLGRKDEEGTIQGINAPAEAAQVCAYLRRDKPTENKEDRLQAPGDRGHPDRGGAHQPPSFEPDGDFGSIDDGDDCAKAFAVNSVQNGQFLLVHLWPGDYQLDFFRSNGQRIEQRKSAVTVKAGQTVNVNAAGFR